MRPYNPVTSSSHPVPKCCGSKENWMYWLYWSMFHASSIRANTSVIFIFLQKLIQFIQYIQFCLQPQRFRTGFSLDYGG
jgi:hypothetical protein